jgi:hypothetical protein
MKAPLIPIAVLFFSLASATADIIHTVADGFVGFTGNVQPVYVDVSSTYHGDLQFAAFDSAAYSAIRLQLEVFSTPVWDDTIDVFGYDNAAGRLMGSDFNAGAFLGTWTLPSLGAGQVASYDVTDFVHSVHGAFFGFELRADVDDDNFSSTEYNHGNPPVLIATEVPEPSSSILIGLALGMVVALTKPWPRLEAS